MRMPRKTTTRSVNHLVINIAIAGFVFVVAGCGKSDNTNNAASSGRVIQSTMDKGQVIARCRDVASRGHKLYIAMQRANIDRESMGIENMWPRTKANVSWDKKDISGMVFADSKQYLNTVFALSQDGKPYCEGGKELAFDINGQVLWSIMLDYDENNMSSKAPLLVSANFDCSKLPSRWPAANVNPDEVIPVGSCPIVGNAAIVIIQKGGGVVFLPADQVTLRNIYGDGKYVLPECYLTPKGIVTTRR